MTRARDLIGIVLLATFCGTSAGCSLFHELQPHRLHRWNRSAPVHDDFYNSSIPDPPLPWAGVEPGYGPEPLALPPGAQNNRTV